MYTFPVRSRRTDVDLFFEYLSQQKFQRLKFKFKNHGCFPRIRRRRHRINESSIALQRFKLLSVSEMQRVEKEVQSLTNDPTATQLALSPFLNSLREKNIPATLRYSDTTEEKDIEFSLVEYVGLRFTYFKADAQNDLEIDFSVCTIGGIHFTRLSGNNK